MGAGAASTAQLKLVRGRRLFHNPLMKIVCAASVLYGREAFSTLGHTVILPDERIARADLLDADALIIRSKTPVTADLIEGAAVAFVGTATAGYDHLDLAALEAAEVAWSAAPGCNANSVAEYVVAALLALAGRRGLELKGRTLGIVGVGEVGRRAADKAAALGLTVLRNDPPLALATRDPAFQGLDDVLARADLVSLHVPLTRSGPFPTWRMANCHFFEHLRPGAMFLNAARGEVMDTEAVLLALERGLVADAAIDVWENEPDLSAELLDRATLATPHIAGYSWDGRLNGTVAVYRAACRFFERAPGWTPPRGAPGSEAPLVVNARGRTDQEAIAELVASVYDIAADDRALRGDGREALADRFRRLRGSYPARREFSAYRVRAPADRPALAAALAALGFRVE